MVKHLIQIMLALACMFCVVPVRGDEPPQKQQEIPIKRVFKKPTIRDLSMFPIQALFNGMTSTIHTTVTSDLGQIEMTVTNLSTGEAWSDTFDSGVIMQTLLPISGTPGYYEIEYITESGDTYVGCFELIRGL